MKLKDNSLLKSSLFINGEWMDPGVLASEEIKSPLDGSLVGSIPRIKNLSEILELVQIQQDNFSQISSHQRALMLERWHELIIQNAQDIATIITHENGKSDAIAEVHYAASFIKWFAEQARRIEGSVLASPDRKHYVVLKKPVGVCAAFTPWNFPAAMITRKVGAMIAAGCCVIIKPSNKTPLTALALVELANRAGLGNQINVINGDPKNFVEQLSKSSIIKKLSFTGSTFVGKQIAGVFSSNLTRLTLELGGNAPFVVFEDADMKTVLKELRASKFRNAGQTCISPNRFYIEESIYKSFVNQLILEVSDIKVGNPLEGSFDFSCLIDSQAVDRVHSLVRDAIHNGAKLLVGGKPNGNFYPVTILAGVKQSMRIANEEIFGPVISLLSFKNEDDVLSLCNNTGFGLASYVFTSNAKRQWRFANELDFGMVGINSATGLSGSFAPFGGVKGSGFGREGSKWGIEEYLDIKSICIDP